MKPLREFDIVCIDFDETLFNHASFNSWTDNILVKEGLIQSGAFNSTMDEYHDRLSEVLRLYRHEDHAKDVVGREWSYLAGYLKQKLRSDPQDFCYEDADDFLRHVSGNVEDVRIVSFGHGEYQRFKMSLCKTLMNIDLPIHIVSTPKSEFFQNNFASVKRGVLIDDKYPLGLPKNFTHILIDRSKRYANVAKNDGVIEVETLSQLIV